MHLQDENRASQEIFASQTWEASWVRTKTYEATAEIEHIINGCIEDNEAINWVGYEKCVVGKFDYFSEGGSWIIYFYNPLLSLEMRTFKLIGDSAVLTAYVGDCMSVYGKILMDVDGIPYMNFYEAYEPKYIWTGINEGYYEYFTDFYYQELPDEICSPQMLGP